MTVVKQCPNCKPHPYQDALYGFLNRVFNLMYKDRGFSGKGRCSVCGHVMDIKIKEEPIIKKEEK